MNRLRIIFLSLTLLTYSSISLAGLLVEPVLGYNLATNLSAKGKNSPGTGVGYGGRLGFQTGAFQMGLDYLKSDIYMNSGSYDKNVVEEDYGLFFAYTLPILLRFYGTYIFSSYGDTEISNKNFNLEGGSGFKLGVGFTLIPLLDINLDYRNINYEQGANLDSLMLSLSMPLDLF